MMRVLVSTKVTVMATITVVKPEPMAIINMVARIRPGKASTTSTRRWLTSSKPPPVSPLATPHASPSRSPSSTAPKPTVKEMRAP